MAYQLYIVEDEVSLSNILKLYLEKEGYQVKIFESAEDAMPYIDKPPTLWILDIMLPGMDGHSFIKKIKEQTENVPVIFMSARSKDLDRLMGLELGSDDYISKPFLPRELVIRVNRLIKYIRGEEDQVVLAPYEIDLNARNVVEDKKRIELTAKEFDLLSYFIKHSGQMMSREQILENVWDFAYEGSDRVVDDTVRRLRKKMPKLIVETQYGYGYRLVKQ